METKEFTKRPYLKPAIEVYSVRMESLLQTVSGQHNPIGQGGTTGDAKRATFFDETEEVGGKWESSNPWED